MATTPSVHAAQSTPFRFYDNRQKYLAFVTTCNEKSVVAARCAEELTRLEPTPPALRLFDAGMGDGTVLSRVLRTVHHLFPTVPVLVVAKEISLEDVRLGLEKMPDRFVEHPHTVLVVTNLSYADAPALLPSDPERAAALSWQEVPLEGASAHDLGTQIEALGPRLASGWETKPEPRDRQPDPAAALGARALPPRPRVPARRRNRAPPAARRLVRLRPRVATVAREDGRRVQGREDPRAVGPQPGARRPPPHRSSPGAAIRPPRSSSGSGRARMPFTGRPARPARLAADELGRRGGRLRPRRPLRRGRGLPLRDAHAAVRDRRPDRHIDAVRRLERRDLREPDRGRAPPGDAARGAVPRRDTGGPAASTAALWFNDEAFVVERHRNG